LLLSSRNKTLRWSSNKNLRLVPKCIFIMGKKSYGII
jgi:hypothetical protein